MSPSNKEEEQLDEDIDKMQKIIEGECPFCTVMYDEDEYSHDEYCRLFVPWIDSTDRAEILEKYRLTSERIRNEIRADVRARLSYSRRNR